MFAHPATHNFSRTYGGHSTQGHQTTGRKNVNKENAAALPSKTPSRMGGKMVPSTSMRMGLGVKTVERDGNVQGRGDIGKGKGREGDDIEPKRLFASTSGPSKTNAGLPPSKSMTSFPVIQARTVNTHRTPAPNKTLKHATNLRTPAPAQMIPPTPTPLPSATRTRRRSRHSLTPLQSHPVQQTFQTPAPSAHQWEEEASLGSITEGLEGVDIGSGLDGVVEVDEGDDEVEYMPPPVKELPWEPAFEHPDLNAVFSSLSTLPPLWTLADTPVDLQVDDFVFDEQKIVNIRLCDDDDLEEPMFRKPKLEKRSEQTKRPQPHVGPAPTSRPAPTAGLGNKPGLPPVRASGGTARSVTARPSIRTGSNAPTGLPTRISSATRPPMSFVPKPSSASHGATSKAPIPNVSALDLGEVLDIDQVPFDLDLSLDDEKLLSP